MGKIKVCGVKMESTYHRVNCGVFRSMKNVSFVWLKI